MTLILTLATPRYILQVSDRLVTQRLVTQDVEPFEPPSNKNIIYLARNAIVTIGYSGRAYMDGVPTDRWIAEKLRGKRFVDCQPGKPFAFTEGRGAHWLDIGQSLELLRDERERVNARLPVDERLQISLAGWQWRRRGRRFVARPILHEIKNDIEGSQSRRVKHKPLPRYWHYSADAPDPSVIPAQNMCKSEMKDLRDALQSAAQDPQYAEQLLVTTIRRVAKEKPVVGADCMVIYIPMPSLRVVKARHVAAESQESASATGFSPWVVGPCAVTAPSEIMGDQYVGLGPVTVSMEGSKNVVGRWPAGFPEPPDELNELLPPGGLRTVAYMGSQRRKGYP